MTELTEDQIVHIEFVYDLSTIQAQIDELTAKQSGQGGKNADTNAEVLAANQNISLLPNKVYKLIMFLQKYKLR